MKNSTFSQEVKYLLDDKSPQKEAVSLTLHISDYIVAAVQRPGDEIKFLQLPSELNPSLLRSCLYVDLATNQKCYGAEAEKSFRSALNGALYGKFYFEYLENMSMSSGYGKYDKSELNSMIAELVYYVVRKAIHISGLPLAPSLPCAGIRIWHPAHLSFSRDVAENIKSMMQQQGTSAEVAFYSDYGIYDFISSKSAKHAVSVVVLDWASDALRLCRKNEESGWQEVVSIPESGGKNLDESLWKYLMTQECSDICRYDVSNIQEVEYARVRLKTSDKETGDSLVLRLRIKDSAESAEIKEKEFHVVPEYAYADTVRRVLSQVENELKNVAATESKIVLYLVGSVARMPFIRKNVDELCKKLSIGGFTWMDERYLLTQFHQKRSPQTSNKRRILRKRLRQHRQRKPNVGEFPRNRMVMNRPRVQKAENESAPAAESREKSSFYDVALSLLESNNKDDVSMALAYLRIAANEGKDIQKATETLGVILSDGKWNGRPVAEARPEEALRFLRKAAEYSPIAMNYLGIHYYDALGVERDQSAAFGWFLRAAQRGYPAAKVNLSLRYENGEGVPVNFAEAQHWLLEAAEHDKLPSAQLRLSLRYQSGGMGLPRNEEKAYSWCRKAAEKNDGAAQMLLGYYYEQGIGVPTSCWRALRWYHRAVKAKEVNACYLLGVTYERYALTANPSRAEERKKKAVSYYRQGVQVGSDLAMAQLGYCYAEGRLVEKNLEKAIQYYNSAVQQNNVMALNNLAIFYEDGCEPYLQINIEKALELYNRAVEQGSEDAGKNIRNLTSKQYSDDEIMQFRNRALTHDLVSQKNYAYACENLQPDTAKKWMSPSLFDTAAENGHQLSLLLVGRCYREGFGVEKNIKHAINYYEKAAECGNAEYLTELAQTYILADAEFFKDNIMSSLKMACEMNFAPAQMMLGIYLINPAFSCRNREQGIRYIRESAKNGDERAIRFLKQEEEHRNVDISAVIDSVFRAAIPRAKC